MSGRYTQYHNVWLETDQAFALQDLENLLGTKIPDISDNSMGSFGFIHENYKVLELRLFQSYFQENVQLNRLPESIGDLIDMHTLDVSHNQLKSLPDSIAQLEELEKFYLDYNEFRQIPRILSKLENLRQINFDENLLETIPETIGNAPYLQSIHLAGNLLNRFPQVLSSLKYLKRLVLNRNKINSLDYTVLEEFSQLYVLDLRGNPIPPRQIDKALAYLKFSGKKRRKYYLGGRINDYENPYSIRNIKKRMLSDPLLEIDLDQDEEKLSQMALKIKNNYEQRYSVEEKG